MKVESVSAWLKVSGEKCCALAGFRIGWFLTACGDYTPNGMVLTGDPPARICRKCRKRIAENPEPTPAYSRECKKQARKIVAWQVRKEKQWKASQQ